MNPTQHRLTHAFAQLHAMLANVPDSTPANWLTHCVTRLFFWRAASLHWQSAAPEQRARLNTVLNLSEATLFAPVANPAAFDIAPAEILIRQAQSIADTLTALCQAQAEPDIWLATLAPEQFRPATADAARVLIRLQLAMVQLWPDDDNPLAASVFGGMLALIQSAQSGSTTPPELANLLIDLLQPQAGEIIFDPCCGFGNLLCRVARHFQQSQDAAHGVADYRQALLIGEDQRPEQVALARLNLALHGWGYVRLEPRHHPELLGLRTESNQPLWADLVLAVLPADAQIDWAWHALESLHPERGRMALLLAPPLLANHAGQSLLRFLSERNMLHAVIELPEHSLPGRKYTPSCLLVDCRHAAHGVAFISHRFAAASSQPAGQGWQTIRQAWQAHVRGETHPNYLILNSATVKQHKARLDGLPFAAMWGELRREYARMAQQARAKKIHRTAQI